MHVYKAMKLALITFSLISTGAPVLAQPQQVGSGEVAIAAAGAGENFNTLAGDGTSNGLPTGWYFHETGSNANGSYRANDGSGEGGSAPGDTYSLGSNGSSDRAFGTVLSGSLTPTIGARMRNESGQALSEVAIAYTGEQWRLGTSGRADRLDFQYSVDATALLDANATWVDVAALSFTAPVSTGPVGALDGNAAGNRVAVGGNITGLSLAPGQGLWIRWRDFNASGADDALAIDDFTVSVAGGPPIDLPPDVDYTVPADGATNIALDTVLRVVFTEPVQLGDPWYSLECAGTAIAATVGGGPINYSITPDEALVGGQACELLVMAAAVTDLDGGPDPMKADVRIAFTTFDPAAMPAPEIVSVAPGDGAQNVPVGADVRVTFNEHVQVDADAFALACDGAPVTAALSGSGVLWVLAPTDPLPYEAACVFTVNADGVANQYGHTLEDDASFSFGTATQSGDGYYALVNTSSPEQLRCSLHHVIRGHTAFPYSGSGTNTWTILETVQQDPANAGRIIDSYRNRSYIKITDRAGQGGAQPKYNREHTWPNSLGFPSQTDGNGNPNAPYTDVHMLHLTDEGQNSARGNRPLADCATGCTELTTEANQGVGGGSGTYPGNSNWVRAPNGNQGSFQVWNHRKGDIARTILYMAIRYEGGSHPVTAQTEPDLELTDNRSLIVTGSGGGRHYMGLLSDLLDWHADDPPDDHEVLRNDVIQSFQGNRNPFVDHPEWASPDLFTAVSPEVCKLNEPGTGDPIFFDGFE